MADRADIERRIGELFERHLHVRVPSVETDLFETGALDSLGLVDLLVRLEEEFGFHTTVDELEVEAFSSVARIADWVLRRNGDVSAPSAPA